MHRGARGHRAGRGRTLPMGVHGSEDRRGLVPQPVHLGPIQSGMGRWSSDADDDFLEPVLRVPSGAPPPEGRRARSPHRPPREGRRPAARRAGRTRFFAPRSREPLVEYGHVLRPSGRRGREPAGPAAPGRAQYLHLRRPRTIARQDDPDRDDGNPGRSGDHRLAPEGDPREPLRSAVRQILPKPLERALVQPDLVRRLAGPVAFVGEFEVVDDLPHLPHLVDHRARLRDGAPWVVRPAREEDGRPDLLEEVNRRELAVQVGVHRGVSHLLSVVPSQVAALVRRCGEPVEVPDDAHADRPQLGCLLQDMRHGVPAVAHADGSESVGGDVTSLNQPSTARDDVLDVPASQVAVAQAAPGAPAPGPAAVVRREDREALRDQELEPRVPFVQSLRLRAPVRVHDGRVSAAFLSRHKEPCGNLSAIDARVSDELSIGEFALRQRLAKAVDQRGGPLSLSEHEPLWLRERGMVVEQTLGIRGPQGPGRRSLRGRDRAGALAVSGNDLQLDIPVVILEERDPLSVRRPEGHRLVPAIRDDEADALRLDIEHPDVQVIVDVRDERQLPTVRGPGLRSAEVASDRILRVGERDDLLEVALEVRLDRDPPAVRRKLRIQDGLLGLQEDPSLLRPKVQEVDGPLVSLVRGEGEQPAVGGHVEVPELPDSLQEAPRGERDLPCHGAPSRPRNETWDKAISFGDLTGVMTLNVATLPITVGAGAFLVRDGKLLVVRKTYGPSKGLWTIPSGYVEPRESVVQTIEREVKG